MQRRVVPFAAGLAAALILGALAAPAQATAPRPTAAVSLGDSYISGEAGRWKGNASVSTAGFDGTDRAYLNGAVDKTLIYGATAANGCHRSDVAEILSARLPVQRAINLACSGATTKNVLRASAGGVAFKGEAPQDDQLLAVAKANRVRLVTLSIGGNDLGFGSILTSCVVAYLFQTAPCNPAQRAAVAQRLPTVQAAVAATLDDVRATMRAAGYRDGSYRLIMQSYPIPSTSAAKSRFAGDASQARAKAGCPFYDADADWSATLAPTLGATLRAAAAGRAQFLDLTDAFHGHELCAATDSQVSSAPSSAKNEWVRFIDVAGQGDSAESLHPNYFGQKALGRCLALAVLSRHAVACHAVTHLPDWAIYTTRA